MAHAAIGYAASNIGRTTITPMSRGSRSTHSPLARPTYALPARSNIERGAPCHATIDGIATRYEVLGSGPPLLMYSPGGFDATLEKWS